jgi:hypothetical protein
MESLGALQKSSVMAPGVERNVKRKGREGNELKEEPPRNFVDKGKQSCAGLGGDEAALHLLRSKKIHVKVT